jgi:aerobic-type carbon monoxide dehydrogenase small subunit (CoxS/CutS family)
MKLQLWINDQEREFEIAPDDLLAAVLRHGGYVGVKVGCYTGNCGSCTILLDGKAVNSCLILAAQAEGRRIMTIEGLSIKGELHPLQREFLMKGAVQCGFCTPGMLLAAKALLDENPEPTEAEVRQALSGNLCRCTGYKKPVEAVLAAAKALKEGISS